VLPGYSSLEYELTIGLLDGEEEIARFLAGEQKT
jgi:hypothetical protein